MGIAEDSGEFERSVEMSMLGNDDEDGLWPPRLPHDDAWVSMTPREHGNGSDSASLVDQANLRDAIYV